MSIHLHTARYVLESPRCAVVSSDDRSFLLGYFVPPRHEWVFVARFADEAAARRAFERFDESVAEFSRAWASMRERAGDQPPETSAA